MRTTLLTRLAIFAVICCIASGCNQDSGSSTANNTTNTSGTKGESHVHADDGHEHAHTHADGASCACEHGPYNGHIFRFENEAYKGEWVQSKDNDVVRFYLLTSNDEDAPLKVDSFVVTPLAGADSESFELAAESSDADGKSHIYMADEKDLRIAIPLGVTVEIKAGDLVLKGKIDAHEPFDH